MPSIVSRSCHKNASMTCTSIQDPARMCGLKTPFSKQNPGTRKFSCDHIKNAPYVLLAIMLWGLEAKLLPYLAIKAKSNYGKYDNNCLRGLQRARPCPPNAHR